MGFGKKLTHNEFITILIPIIQFWNLPESADDIFSLIGANDIRRTRDTARENFEILIDKVRDTHTHTKQY